jgi:nucleoside-diphosphate-sugar epimerase
MSKILITGAAGFIGSNFATRCADEGIDADGVDDMSNGYERFVEDGRLRNFTISDFAHDEILDRIRNKEYGAVVHFAAVPRVSYSVEHPFATNHVNVTQTLHLMNACRGNVVRFVFASSSSVYGGAETLPTNESAPKDPKSPYALQKSIIEDYLTLYRDLYGLESACLRFFNVFGPRQLGSSPYACAIGAWLTAIKLGKPLRSDGDGTQSRDLCYVDNVVDACFKAMTTENQLDAARMNVACGDRTTNNQVLDYLRNRYGDIVVNSSPWRAGDVMHTQADVSKAKELIDYVPIVRVEEGIARTIDWYEENANWIRETCSR